MKHLMRFFVRNIPRPWLIRLGGVFSKMLLPFYIGNVYQCPICNVKLRKFLPYGNKGLENRLCPSCLSLERHRLLWLWLNEKTDFFSGKHKMLHIAPEQPFIKRFRKLKNIDYTTADLVSPLADVKLDVQNIPYPDNTFSIIFCNHVLEHVENDIIAMKEIYRVLKKRGWAVMQVPVDWNRDKTFEDSSIVDPKEREKYFGQYDHLRFHGTDYPDRLRSVGFDVDNNDFLKRFSAEEKEFYRLPSREMIWQAMKK